MKPRLNARLTALPVWSGPRLNRNVARTSSRSNRLASRGTPSSVPRSVSTSIFRAMRAISTQRARVLDQRGGQSPQIQRPVYRCHFDQLQHAAVTTFDVALTVDAGQLR